MNLNFKLYFKYILFNSQQLFLKYLIRNDKNINLYINSTELYFLALHLKLSSLFYSVQLVDLLAYDLPINKNTTNRENLNNPKLPILGNSVLVYNFHSISHQQRFFIFTSVTPRQIISKNTINWSSTNSITELFLNANWLEREMIELHGIFFAGKKDVRNLMLQYGDTSSPMQKAYPSIGTREIFYDTVTDLLIQNPVSIQF